nr:DUF3604 domain-containing protein [uncultured Shimia sp.]
MLKNWGYSPYVGQDFPDNVYFGDTHVHTNISFDAFGDGNIDMSAEEAYRFAKGEEMTGHDGAPVRMSRPIDFLVLADHAEYLGVIQGVADGNEMLVSTEAGARWATLADEGQLEQALGEIVNDLATNTSRDLGDGFSKTVWQDVIDSAEQHNDPGKFTALIGYEWTSSPDGDNMHRVVIFRDDAAQVSQTIPFSSFDSPSPEDLWKYLQSYEEGTGGRVMSIPHNGNMSAGRMFQLSTYDGGELSPAYAETRMRWEPLVETTQIKGDSETHPALSPDDEFADFESWDKGNFGLRRTTPELMKTEYSRSALKLGLAQEAELGVNPFKFGMIGATDSHTSWSNAEEDNYLGKYATASPDPDRWDKKFPPPTVPGILFQYEEWQSSQSGYAAVWARENTREALWDAMERKEVYATTGPRMKVRFFGGWDYVAKDAKRHNIAAVGYGKGVPMGGDLPDTDGASSPSFLISALRDPDGANLDRVQVIKGWQDQAGNLHELVYDVVWGGRPRSSQQWQA